MFVKKYLIISFTLICSKLEVRLANGKKYVFSHTEIEKFSITLNEINVTFILCKLKFIV